MPARCTPHCTRGKACLYNQQERFRHCMRAAIMNKSIEKNKPDLKLSRKAPLATRTDLSPAATKDIAAAINGMLADAFALYMKTKNVHWHISGPHFRDYHLLLDEQADQAYPITDPMPSRARQAGGA